MERGETFASRYVSRAVEVDCHSCCCSRCRQVDARVPRRRHNQQITSAFKHKNLLRLKRFFGDSHMSLQTFTEMPNVAVQYLATTNSTTSEHRPNL